MVMRLLTGSGTPRQWAATHPMLVCLCTPLDDAHLAVRIAIFTDREPLPIASACLLIAKADR
jgi:hypothetical protein